MKTTSQISEERLLSKQDQETDRLYRKFKPYMESLASHSTLARMRGIQPADLLALGKMLESFETLVQIKEADGSVSDLGQLPNIALDVITVGFGQSVLPYISSVQPIDEENGTVWFKQLVARDARGNKIVGEKFYDPKTGMQELPVGFSSDKITKTFSTTTTAGDLDYSFNLFTTEALPGPIRRGTVIVRATGGDIVGTLTAKDSTDPDQSNAVLGLGMQGTVEYDTAAGVLNIEFIDDPGTGATISVQFAQNFEGATDIPEVQFELTSTNVKAEVYALKGVLGLLKSFALRKRFGLLATEEIAKDLTNELNAEIGGRMLSEYYSALATNTNFDRTVPTGISEYEHRQSFKYRILEAERKLVDASKRGQINVMAGGLEFCEIVSGLPGFTLMPGVSSNIGPHLFGTLDGRTIIRVPQSNVIPSAEGVCLYRGATIFDAPGVYAPYMPLIVTDDIPVGGNPLLTQKAAATWAATKVLVEQFLTKITVVTS